MASNHSKMSGDPQTEKEWSEMSDETFRTLIAEYRELEIVHSNLRYQRGSPMTVCDHIKMPYGLFKEIVFRTNMAHLESPSEEEIRLRYAARLKAVPPDSYGNYQLHSGTRSYGVQMLRIRCKGQDVEEALPKLFDAVRLYRREKWGTPLIVYFELGHAVNFACRNEDSIIHLRNPSEQLPFLTPWFLQQTSAVSDEVNYLLEMSLFFQMADPINSGMGCIMSSDSLAVNGMVHFYLKSLGIDSDLHCGTLRVKDHGLPLAWLTVEGQLIDNTYHYWPGNQGGLCHPQLFSLKKEEFYVKEDPAKSAVPLITELGSQTCVTDPKIFQAYAKPENIQKFLFFRSEYPSVYPNFQLYICGIGHMSECMEGSELKSRLGYIDTQKERARMTLHCWTCGAKKAGLKQCNECKIAKYCDSGCQAADWPVHKLLHKDVKVNTEFQKQRKSRK